MSELAQFDLHVDAGPQRTGAGGGAAHAAMSGVIAAWALQPPRLPAEAPRARRGASSASAVFVSVSTSTAGAPTTSIHSEPVASVAGRFGDR
jgi:hypothetical protein